MCSFLLLALGVICCWWPADATMSPSLGTRRLEGGCPTQAFPAPALQGYLISDVHPVSLGQSRLGNEEQKSAS